MVRKQVREMALKKGDQLGWRDGSQVKSTVCSYRGPEFNSRKPHSGSQPSIVRSGLQAYIGMKEPVALSRKVKKVYLSTA